MNEIVSIFNSVIISKAKNLETCFLLAAHFWCKNKIKIKCPINEAVYACLQRVQRKCAVFSVNFVFLFFLFRRTLYKKEMSGRNYSKTISLNLKSLYLLVENDVSNLSTWKIVLNIMLCLRMNIVKIRSGYDYFNVNVVHWTWFVQRVQMTWLAPAVLFGPF